MDTQAVPTSSKSRLMIILMAAIMGLIGVHRFYLGRTNAGIMTLAIFLGGLTFYWILPVIIIAWGFLSAWAIYDIAMITRGGVTDADGLPITRW